MIEKNYDKLTKTAKMLLFAVLIVVTGAISITVYEILRPNLLDVNSTRVKETEVSFSLIEDDDWSLTSSTSYYNHSTLLTWKIREDGTSPCQVMAYVLPGPIDIEYEMAKTISAYEQIPATVTLMETIPMRIKSYKGDVSYELHQFDVASNKSDVMKGIQTGYAQLDESAHLKIETHCERSDQLQHSLQALESIKLNGAK